MNPSPHGAAADAGTLSRPGSPFALFIAFSLLALQGFGGVLAVAQRELVDRRGWLSRAEFIELYSIAQMLPGPNVVNLSLMIGDRYFGWRGALAAITGMLLAPFLIVIALAASYERLAEFPAVAGALRGMGAVAAGLIIATGIKLIAALRSNVMGPAACALLALASFVAIALLRWPLGAVLLVIGGAGCAWAWHRLGATPTPPGPLAHGAPHPAALTDADSGQKP